MCSAGVGRTGTFIGLDVLKAELEARREVNVLNAVYEMRLNRTEMVQSLVSCIRNFQTCCLSFTHNISIKQKGFLSSKTKENHSWHCLFIV